MYDQDFFIRHQNLQRASSYDYEETLLSDFWFSVEKTIFGLVIFLAPIFPLPSGNPLVKAIGFPL